MRRIVLVAVLALLATVSVAVWESRSEVLRLAEGNLTWDGAPLANQTLVIEGTVERSWPFKWLLFNNEPEKFSRLVITDGNGYVQLVDMPAGTYTIKLVRPGAAKPVPIGHFTLDPGYTKYDFSAKFEEKPIR